MNRFFIFFLLTFTAGILFFSTTSYSENPKTILKNVHLFSENEKPNLDVLHYSISVDLDVKKRIIEGKVIITCVVPKIKNEIVINFYENMQINSLRLNEDSIFYKREKNNIIIDRPESNSDTIILMIDYRGTPQRVGLSSFVFGSINKQSLVFNLNQPNYASTWFPCNDDPSDKALLDIKITNDIENISVSNGILVDSFSVGNRKTFHWRSLYPISTYLIAIYSSNYIHFSDKYVSITGDTLPLEYYVLPNQLEEAKIDFEVHPKIFEIFENLFGPYPFIKEKYGVATFLWQLGAMEHQTITGIGSNFIGGNKFFTDIYVHELAHHWWGNSVGPKTWKDIWLSEGFATYSEALYHESISGKDGLISTMQSKFRNDFQNTLYNPGNDLFTPTVYDKGAWVLHMLRKKIGDENFFKSLRKYYELYKYSNASTLDFLKVCEDVSQKNLTQFFSQWVFVGEGIIEANYSWNFNELNEVKTLEIKIEQRQTGYNEYQFPLEIKLIYENEIEEIKTIFVNQRNYKQILLVESKPLEIIFDPDNWLLAELTEENN